MDTTVDILATGEIALLGRVLAKVIERHGADLTQFAQEEVGQRLQLRCVGRGLALLGLLRRGSSRCCAAVDLRRRQTTVILGLGRNHWHRTVLTLHLSRHRTAGRLGLGGRTMLALGLDHRAALGLRRGNGGAPVRTVSLGQRRALLLGLRR